jgi:hypothetical protein
MRSIVLSVDGVFLASFNYDTKVRKQILSNKNRFFFVLVPSILLPNRVLSDAGVALKRKSRKFLINCAVFIGLAFLIALIFIYISPAKLSSGL